MAADNKTTEPADAFHPSEFIIEELSARNWSMDDLAVLMGGDAARNRLVLDLYCLVGPEKPNMLLGEETADQIAQAFGVSARFLLNLHDAWRRSKMQ